MQHLISTVLIALLFSFSVACSSATQDQSQSASLESDEDSTSYSPAEKVQAEQVDEQTASSNDEDNKAEADGELTDIADYSCQSDSDCAVKDVGSCCGMYLSCVNANSPTDPGKVQAECKKKGLMSTCGFREISSCQCVQGRCEASDDGVMIQ